MRKIGKIVVDIALGAVCTAAIIILLVIIVIPMLMGAKRYIILSDSMAPAIRAGDIVIVKPVEPGALKLGEIVTFWQDGQPVTHRIVSIDAEKKLIYAKGDANEAQDFTPVKFEEIIGSVKYKVPYLGNITLAIKGE